MPTIEAEREFDTSPETIWRVLIAMSEWPEWSPLFQLARNEQPEQGLQGEWTLHGLVGRMPYSGTFEVFEHRPTERFGFASLTVSPPFHTIRHEITLERRSRPHLTWRLDYTPSGGPGGWLIDRLLIRRSAADLLERALTEIQGIVEKQ